MQYKVLTGNKGGIPELEEKVTKHLGDGWKPIGGIAFNQGYPYQAMATTKPAAKKKDNENKAEAPKPKNIASDEYY